MMSYQTNHYELSAFWYTIHNNPRARCPVVFTRNPSSYSRIFVWVQVNKRTWLDDFVKSHKGSRFKTEWPWKHCICSWNCILNIDLCSSMLSTVYSSVWTMLRVYRCWCFKKPMMMWMVKTTYIKRNTTWICFTKSSSLSVSARGEFYEFDQAEFGGVRSWSQSWQPNDDERMTAIIRF